MLVGYSASGLQTSRHYSGWSNYSQRPYVSDTHGSRYVSNYANAVGSAYGRFEDSGPMPVGTVLAKDSFLVTPDGKVSVGPLFLMEKMPAGFRAESGNWQYTLVMPNGTVAGVTNGAGDANVEFCIGCHAAVGDTQDHMMFLPEPLRVGN